MSAQKLMIIALVALAVIFLITLGIGGCHGSGTPNPNRAGFVGALKGLQGKRFLEIGDKASANPPSCGVPGANTLTFNGTCVITFDKRAFFRRSTRVVLQPNRPMRVVIAPNDGPRQDVQLPEDGDFCFASAVNHSGGTMTLTSPPGNTTVALLRQGCPE
jgi:hypothetical protein